MFRRQMKVCERRFVITMKTVKRLFGVHELGYEMSLLEACIEAISTFVHQL